VNNFDEEFTKEGISSLFLFKINLIKDAINSVITGGNIKLLNEYEDDFRDFDKKK